ncbi:MAG TPA: copper resistance protein CopC [Nitrososphaeraceae archaeon]|nr:copper resistance protein CopC [Nitrososphaeraceae archaeon]
MRDLKKIIFLSFNLIFFFLLCITSYFPSQVYAHPIVIDSNPKQFQSLENPPDRVIVYFSEPIVLPYSQISVIDSEGTRVDEGNSENYNGDTSTISVTLKPDIGEGTFTINTKVLSAVDGHVVDGSVVYSIGTGVADFSHVKSESKDIVDLLSIENSLSRIPGYVGQIVIVGATFIFLWIQKPLSKFEWIKGAIQLNLYLIKRDLIKLIIIGTILVLFSIIAILLIQATAIGGSVGDVLTTEFGKIILIRLGLTLVLFAFLLFYYKKIFKNSKKTRDDVKYFIVLICLGLGLLFTNSMISHSAALKSFGPVLIDYFHGIAASFWIGGLIFLTFVFVSKIFLIKDEELKAKIISMVIPRFSTIIIPVLGSISITGPILLWSLEANLSTTIASLYGKILIVKLILAAIMIIIGGYHQFITEKKISTISIKQIQEKGHSKGTIASEPNFIKRFMWSLRIEALVGLGLLFVVSLMTNMVLPSGELPSSNITNNSEAVKLENPVQNSNIYSTVVYSENQKIQIHLEPARLGENKIFVEFSDYNNNPTANIINASIKLSQIERGIGPILIDMEKISNGRFNAIVPISALGPWNFEIQGKTLQPNAPNTIATFEINIKPRISDLQFNITEYKTPQNSMLLNPMYQASTDSIWVGDSLPGSGKLWQFDIANQNYQEHTINGINLITLSVFDPINTNILWFIDPTSNILGNFNTDTNKTETYEIPNKGVISGLTIDNSGNIWISIIQDNSILKYDINKNSFETFKIPTENSRPLSLIYDENNNDIWFAESIGKIGRLDIETKTINEYPNDTKSDALERSILSEPTALLFDAKNSYLYISDHEKNSVIRFNTFTSVFKEYPLTDINGLAFGMALDAYNNLWIAQHVSDTLAILDPDTGETMNIEIPTSNSFVQYLVTDSKKDVWFAEQRGNALGKVTIKFIPNNSQNIASTPSSITDNDNNNNNNNNQTDRNIANKSIFNILRFNDFFGPFIIIAVAASTILYVNSREQLRKKLLEIENIEDRNN